MSRGVFNIVGSSCIFSKRSNTCIYQYQQRMFNIAILFYYTEYPSLSVCIGLVYAITAVTTEGRATVQVTTQLGGERVINFYIPHHVNLHVFSSSVL